MAQGLFGGMTNYEDQSIDDILDDINQWITYTEEIKQFTEKGIDKLKETNYWNRVPFNFQLILTSSIRTENTFLHDLKLVAKVIEQNQLCEREVKLMKKIGKNAIEYNEDFGRSYKEDSDWKEYGDGNFRIAEDLYAKGRDYFVTLQDASNIAARLSDYITPSQPVVNNTIQQTIHGNGHVIAGNNSGTINNSVVINVSQFSSEVESAINALKLENDIDSELREHVTEILEESNVAVQKGDVDSQKNSKIKMESLLKGAGSRGIQLLHLLGTYSSIASYYNF